MSNVRAMLARCASGALLAVGVFALCTTLCSCFALARRRTDGPQSTTTADTAEASDSKVARAEELAAEERAAEANASSASSSRGYDWRGAARESSALERP